LIKYEFRCHESRDIDFGHSWNNYVFGNCWDPGPAIPKSRLLAAGLGKCTGNSNLKSKLLAAGLGKSRQVARNQQP